MVKLPTVSVMSAGKVYSSQGTCRRVRHGTTPCETLSALNQTFVTQGSSTGHILAAVCHLKLPQGSSQLLLVPFEISVPTAALKRKW